MNRHNPFSIHAAVDPFSMEYFLFFFQKSIVRILCEVFLQTRLKLYILLQTLTTGSLQILTTGSLKSFAYVFTTWLLMSSYHSLNFKQKCFQRRCHMSLPSCVKFGLVSACVCPHFSLLHFLFFTISLSTCGKIIFKSQRSNNPFCSGFNPPAHMAAQYNSSNSTTVATISLDFHQCTNKTHKNCMEGAVDAVLSMNHQSNTELL